MRIDRVTLLALDIPFVDQFAHATKARRASDALLLRIESSRGLVAWGETLVRPYLSGETVASSFEAMKTLTPRLIGSHWDLGPASADPLERLGPVTSALDDLLSTLPSTPTIRAYTGIRCAIELAIVDALLRDSHQGLIDILPPVRKDVTYSGIISAEEPDKSLKIARQLRQLGIQHYKLKITPRTAVDLVRQTRALIGSASLRLDANASFDPEAARDLCGAVEAFHVAAVEEPLRDATPRALSALQSSTPIPIMVDEGLVTLGDAERLIDHGACRMMNVRIAKCGGIVPCLRIMEKAVSADIGLQLGALVGETAILSTVGRTLAAASDKFSFVEGSYGTLLLKEDIGRRSVRFGHGGRAPLLRGVGLGVDVDEAIVQKYVVDAIGS